MLHDSVGVGTLGLLQFVGNQYIMRLRTFVHMSLADHSIGGILTFERDWAPALVYLNLNGSRHELPAWLIITRNLDTAPFHMTV